MFTFGCKQSNTKEKPKPTVSNEITITVKGDSNCTVAKLNEIKVKKSLNLTWKEIKLLATSIITLAQDKEIKEWRLTNAEGAVLKDTDKFEKDVTVFAVSQKKQENSPSTNEEITITVQGDSNCTVAKLNEIKVKKNLNLTWKEIKLLASSIITLAKDKEIKEWRLTNADGAVIEESKTFAENTTVFAVTKDKENVPPTSSIVLIIQTDSGYIFKETTTPCTIIIEKGSAWASVKTKAEAKIELKTEYEKTGWKLGGKNGSKIEDDAIFNENQTIYASSKKKDEAETPKITITVEGDEGVEIGSPDNFEVEKGSEWVDIKTQAEEKAKVKDNYEIIEWHLGDALGAVLTDLDQFNENKTVFAKTKQIRKKVTYKVEHYKRELNLVYTKVDTEEKEGLEGTQTQAEAKIYEGFTASNIEQKYINANGATVVRIRYERNTVSLIIDLAGGVTSTKLEDGENGKKLLKGKFEAEVNIKEPTKNDGQFDRWEPALPTHFPANDATVYVAQWVQKTEYRVTIKGDGRVKISEPDYVNVPISTQKTFGAIKSDLTAKVSFTDKWSSEEYVIYDWRIGDETGEEMLDSTPITKDITVYARTNYNKFHLNGTTLEGYSGEKPRGRIFLPKEIEVIKHGAFSKCEGLTVVDCSACIKLKNIENGNSSKGAFQECKKLRSVNFAGCVELTSIGNGAFDSCKVLQAVDLSNCTNLTSIGDRAFELCESLAKLDLSKCTNLNSIGKHAFAYSNNFSEIDLSGCTKLTTIEAAAFSQCENLQAVDLSNCTELTSIGDNAFIFCSRLERVDLKACTKLQRIGRYAFKACSLESIDLSACTKLQKIEPKTFSECKRFTVVDLSNCTELTSIEEEAFFKCENLWRIDLPVSPQFQTIGRKAFYECYNLRTLDLINCTELTSIGEDAFDRCFNLNILDLSACIKLKKLAKDSFYGYTGTVKLPASITEIEERAFGQGSNFPSKVLVPNETIKELVMDSGYPEDRIELY